jgi:hypothetical protein
MGNREDHRFNLHGPMEIFLFASCGVDLIKSLLSLTYRKLSTCCLLAFIFQLFSALLFVQCICHFIFKIIAPASYYICLWNAFFKILHASLNPLLYFSQLFPYSFHSSTSPNLGKGGKLVSTLILVFFAGGM